MMWPPPAAFMCGTTARIAMIGPCRLIAMLSSMCRSRAVSSVPGTKIAALFTRMSIRPHSATTCSTAPVMLSASRRLSTTGRAVPPSARISSVTEWIVPGSRLSVTCSVRAATATFAPARARYFATSAPIPRLAPATIATFPSSVISSTPQQLSSGTWIFTGARRGPPRLAATPAQSI